MVVLQPSSCCQLKKDRCESVALSNVRIHAVARASGHARGRIGRPSVRHTRVTLALEHRSLFDFGSIRG